MKFPDAAMALCDLLDREDSPATPGTFLPTDEYGEIDAPLPFAHVMVTGGSVGYIDRADDVHIDVYSQDEDARMAAEKVAAYLCGDQKETAAGFIDSIDLQAAPAATPWPSQAVTRASMRLTVVSRPI